MKDADTQKLQEAFGLAGNEARVFFALADKPEGLTVVQLAKTLNAPRPTIYNQLERLIGKQIVGKGIDESGSRYFVEDTDVLETVLHEKSKALAKTAGELESVFADSKESGSVYTPRFSFYQEKGAAEKILRNILFSREREVYAFWPVRDMLQVIPHDVYREFHEERVRRRIKLYVLWPTKRKVKPSDYPELGSMNTKESLREIRILPENVDIHMASAVYGNKVGFISSKKENYGFIIDSPELAKTMRAQFLYLWEKGKSLE